LRAEKVGVRYPDAPRAALTDVDVELRDGGLLAVTGANGSGKSSLALVLGGLLAPTTGRVGVEGGPSARPPHRWRAPALARRIGSVFQDPEHQFVTSQVAEELALGPRAAGMSETDVEARVADLLERLRLSHLARANPFTLSGGEARRLSVATALSCAPRILVLDEPTFGQDRRTWGELVDLIAGLRDSGHAIAVVTHDTDFTDALADRTLVMEGGRTC
jgi:energy-coupling factor transport system ATP-binding protein